MHYEQHIQEIHLSFFEPFKTNNEKISGNIIPNLKDVRKETDCILQNINRRKGKIVSVTPITEGYFDHEHGYSNYAPGVLEGYSYGWGTSPTSALLYIVEYPD